MTAHGTDDPTKCVERVPNGNRSFSFRQCRQGRGHGPDGRYCRQHDPERRRAADVAELTAIARALLAIAEAPGMPSPSAVGAQFVRLAHWYGRAMNGGTDRT